MRIVLLTPYFRIYSIFVHRVSRFKRFSYIRTEVLFLIFFLALRDDVILKNLVFFRNVKIRRFRLREFSRNDQSCGSFFREFMILSFSTSMIAPQYLIVNLFVFHSQKSLQNRIRRGHVQRNA